MGDLLEIKLGAAVLDANVRELLLDQGEGLRVPLLRDSLVRTPALEQDHEAEDEEGQEAHLQLVLQGELHGVYVATRGPFLCCLRGLRRGRSFGSGVDEPLLGSCCLFATLRLGSLLVLVGERLVGETFLREHSQKQQES